MAAYMVVRAVSISARERIGQYARATHKIIEQRGGRYLNLGDKFEALEGGDGIAALLLVEFPTVDDIKAFYASPEYKEVKKLREGAAVIDVWAVPGA